MTIDQLLAMTLAEQAAWFEAKVRAEYSTEEADWLLDPGPEGSDEYDAGPNWREWQAGQDAAHELADLRRDH